MPGHDAEQFGEHGRVRYPPGGQVTDQQCPDRPLERPLVEGVGPGGHLEQGVGQRHRVAPVQREQQPLQGRAELGVQAADRAEVDQTEPPVRQQHDVARMRVRVESTVDDDLPQQAVEQAAGQPLAVAVRPRAERPAWLTAIPSSRCMTSTRLVLRSWWACGITTWAASPSRAAAILGPLAALTAARLPASTRKSSSSRRAAAKLSARATAPSVLAHGEPAPRSCGPGAP